MTVAELMAALAAFNFSDEVVIAAQGRAVTGSGQVAIGSLYRTTKATVAIWATLPLWLADPLDDVLTDTRLAEPSTADKIRALGVGQSILLDKPQTSVSSYASQIGRRLGRRYKTKQSKDRTSTTVVRVS
jgi:hypothetical protein